MKTEPSPSDIVEMAKHRLLGHQLYWCNYTRMQKRLACEECDVFIGDRFDKTTQIEGVITMFALVKRRCLR